MCAVKRLMLLAMHPVSDARQRFRLRKNRKKPRHRGLLARAANGLLKKSTFRLHLSGRFFREVAMTRKHSNWLLATGLGLACCVLQGCQQDQETETSSTTANSENLANPTAPVVEARLAPAPKSKAPELTEPINVNTATAKELAKLPSIGPILAQRVIDGRPYGTVEDLLEVDGIGKGTLEKINTLVTLD